jgi:hypothetical protein
VAIRACSSLRAARTLQADGRAPLGEAEAPAAALTGRSVLVEGGGTMGLALAPAAARAAWAPAPEEELWFEPAASSGGPRAGARAGGEV